MTGDFGFFLASAAGEKLSLQAVDEAIYGVVLFMAVATTLIAPPFLVRLFKDERRVDEETLVPLAPIS
jgi:Kef-type K+ transport system membrane component KefB